MRNPQYILLLGGALLATALALSSMGLPHRLIGQEVAKAPPESSEPAASIAGERENKSNRLIREKSPYLLQHAYNPVEWYPWGEEAFEKARNENKPIFLSVGYSTCHWCHVMERESFSDRQIAAVLNERFVSIKVDREERPDVDQVYMAFVQATTGRGGWPMSVFLTPELKPFFGGTYWPPQNFKGILLKIGDEWKNNREAILASAGRVTEALRNHVEASADGDLKLEKELLDRTYEWYVSSYDSSQGGFGRAPKFPRPVDFTFLLRYHARTGDKTALEMVAHTLRQMARGGIHDHVGGGFHRYSTDDRWFLPHFEKMLYDQAQLAVSYLEVYQITEDGYFADVARGILDYVLRDMTGEEGGFYSAEDADSSVSNAAPEEHAEGAFYVWAHEEIVGLLGEDAAPFNHFYGVKKGGNVDRDPFDEFAGKNVLHVSASLKETAETFGRSIDEIERILKQGRERLFEVRTRRPRPLLDDKVLTAWNGLTISAFARGYQILQEDRYLEAAEKAAVLIADRLYDREAQLLKRRYRQGDVAIAGFLDDYAFFIQALLDLYETSLDGRWLLLALELAEIQVRLFWDETQGGFYTTASEGDPSILIRMKDDYDGAEPSPNSVTVLNLFRLSQMADDQKWKDMAEGAIHAFEKRLVQTPQAMPQMMAAVNFRLDKPKQIIIAGRRDSPHTRAILREVHRRFIPNKIVILADGGKAQQRLAESLEILDSIVEIGGKATAYICEDYVCKLPTNEVAAVARLLDE